MNDMVSLHSIASADSAARMHHEHDCECCTFIGYMMREGDECARDVYVCGGKPSLGVSETELTLITRFGKFGDYESFPVYVARHVGRNNPEFHRWPLAIKLYDQWVAGGCPDHTAEHMGDQFFDQFHLAASMDQENFGDGEQYGARVHVIGISSRVNEQSIELFLEARYYATHCTHEHDCCGHTYRDRPTWSYAPGLQNRVILVNQGWRVNI